MNIKNLLLYRVLIILCILSLTACPQIPTNPDNGQSGTGNEDCDFSIDHFNRLSTGRLLEDIKHVKEGFGGLPEEMSELYPAARDAWNQAIRSIVSSYPSENYLNHLGQFNGPYDTWRQQSPSDFDRFFLLLTEKRYGPYPEGSLDVSKLAGWVEKANIRSRLGVHVRLALTQGCSAVNATTIRSRLKPGTLPQNIEDIN